MHHLGWCRSLGGGPKARSLDRVRLRDPLGAHSRIALHLLLASPSARSRHASPAHKLPRDTRSPHASIGGGDAVVCGHP